MKMRHKRDLVRTSVVEVMYDRKVVMTFHTSISARAFADKARRLMMTEEEIAEMEARREFMKAMSNHRRS